MTTSSDGNNGPVPWWKRLWYRAFRASPPPPAPDPASVKIVVKQAKSKPRVAVPIKPQAEVKGLAPSRVAGAWQIYTVKDSPDTAPIHIVHSNRQVFSIIFQSKDGWLFWNGPKKKVFTRPGQGDIWTTPDPKIAAIVANFIHSSKLPELPAPDKPKRR